MMPTTICASLSSLFLTVMELFCFLSLAFSPLSHQYEMIPAGPETGSDWSNQVSSYAQL